MTDQERANKEIEVANWMKNKGYDRRTYKDIAPIIVKYTEEQLAIDSVISRFQTLAKERDIFFYYDEEDGYFIKLSDKGTPPTRYEIAELTPTHQKSMINAMKFAVEWMIKKDEYFRLLMSRHQYR